MHVRCGVSHCLLYEGGLRGGFGVGQKGARRGLRGKLKGGA